MLAPPSRHLEALELSVNRRRSMLTCNAQVNGYGRNRWAQPSSQRLLYL